MINLTRIHANIRTNIRFYHDFWPKFPFYQSDAILEYDRSRVVL